jgi:hypothetical protein
VLDVFLFAAVALCTVNGIVIICQTFKCRVGARSPKFSSDSVTLIVVAALIGQNVIPSQLNLVAICILSATAINVEAPVIVIS